jgi:hypothetical protein
MSHVANREFGCLGITTDVANQKADYPPPIANLRLRRLLQVRHSVAVSHYIANVRDLEFNLFEVLELGTVPLRPSSTTPPTTHVH